MIEIIDLNFDYEQKLLLYRINFVLNSGTLLHLRGKNGSGKTTLMRLMAGLLHPLQGDIRYHGESIYNNLWGYQQNLCYVGHKLGVSQILTVAEHCHFELDLDRTSERLNRFLALFSLEEYWDVPCHLLSAGLLRKVGLLRVLLSDTSLWLLDEPLVALDTSSMDVFMQCMKEHLQRDGMIIVTSHQPITLDWDHYSEYAL